MFENDGYVEQNQTKDRSNKTKKLSLAFPLFDKSADKSRLVSMRAGVSWDSIGAPSIYRRFRNGTLVPGAGSSEIGAGRVKLSVSRFFETP